MTDRQPARFGAPIIEPHMFRLPAFGTATMASVIFGTAFGAMLLLVTLWCQDVWHWSALRTGLGVAPGPLLVPFLSVGAGPLARRVGPGPVALLGCLVYAGGCLFWRLSLSLTPDYAAHMLPGMLMTGIGVGLTLPTLVSAAVAAVPSHRFATGSGVVTMARQVGGRRCSSAAGAGATPGVTRSSASPPTRPSASASAK
ncbi:MAG TPA: MFS transporter [Trebonia sp.]|nr:MFS transporter [Trebonia sp.]